MAADETVPQSEKQQETERGFLFRLSIRVGAIVFFIVLAVAIYEGLEPGLALIRASAVLLAIASCGWIAEFAAKVTPHTTPEVQPAPAPEPAPDDFGRL